MEIAARNPSDVRFNEVYSAHFQAPYPVRTTVEAGLRGFLVELDVIAVRD